MISKKIFEILSKIENTAPEELNITKRAVRNIIIDTMLGKSEELISHFIEEYNAKNETYEFVSMYKYGTEEVEIYRCKDTLEYFAEYEGVEYTGKSITTLEDELLFAIVHYAKTNGKINSEINKSYSNIV